jgi:hypothetical protein
MRASSLVKVVPNVTGPTKTDSRSSNSFRDSISETLLCVDAKRPLRRNPQSTYTPAMTLNNAASLALIGMILATILLVAGFVGDVFAAVRGLIPAMRLLTSFIYAFAGLSMVLFLYAFKKAQS